MNLTELQAWAEWFERIDPTGLDSRSYEIFRNKRIAVLAQIKRLERGEAEVPVQAA